MANKKEKKIRKVKRNHIWSSAVVFVVTCAAFWLIAKFFAYFLGTYFVRSKMTSEYESVAAMARVYENADSAESVCPYLDKIGRSYIIRSGDGTDLYKNGDMTITPEKITLSVTSDFDTLEIYKDRNNYFKNDGKGNISVDVRDVAKLIFGMRDSIPGIPEHMIDDIDHDPMENMRTLNNSFYDTLKFPVWISLPVKGGVEHFIGQTFLKVGVMDFGLLLIFGAIMLVLALIIFMLLSGNLIHEVYHSVKAKKLLFTDDITKGYNMTWFIYRGNRMLRSNSNMKKKYAVVNLIIVKYRNFCSCHSIEEGEKQLRMVYEKIRGMLLKNEIAAHSTSSNFALLLECENLEQTKLRVENIIGELKKISSGHSFNFQAGIAMVDVLKNENGKYLRRKNADVETEYNNACTARATIEGNGDSGAAVFDERLIEEQKWLDLVQDEQKTALENEEFVVYYQPKYNPGTSRLCGAEALIRWQSPEHGFVPPGKFIPIFEKNGFITEIDHYMLRHVARDVKRWQDAGLNCVPVSVNVSRAHFSETDLAEQIRDMVDEAGADRKLIEIELTESAFFDDKKALISTILKLKDYGFSVSMDDFGSGYSSLNSLKDMPLDILKLDAEFFRGESADTRGKIVVSETIRLAKSLDMRTVAEGVEVKEQVDFLAEQGCDMIQGYYFAKPMPGKEFEERMK
ncbi:MAG: EAL domain-containing protein [Treponema sp.]|nr:EAL domain-containing protein [Treponema sp.]